MSIRSTTTVNEKQLLSVNSPACLAIIGLILAVGTWEAQDAESVEDSNKVVERDETENSESDVSNENDGKSAIIESTDDKAVDEHTSVEENTDESDSVAADQESGASVQVGSNLPNEDKTRIVEVVDTEAAIRRIYEQLERAIRFR